MDPAAEAAVDIASDDEEIPLAVHPTGNAPDMTSNLPFEVYTGFHDGLDDSTVEQFMAFIKGEKRSSSNGGRDHDDDDDDDDCVMLDGDPDKAVIVAVEKKLEEDGSEAELQITAEKGEVACRDFPHPRHLCARLPFGASPRANHCTMCHCYVCDCRAPCPYWGNGTSPTDHCHATDKDREWKYLRDSVKYNSPVISNLKQIQDAMSPPSSSSQVNQTNLVQIQEAISTPSNGDLNQEWYSSIRAADQKMWKVPSRPKLPTRRPAINGESFKRSAAPSLIVYTSPFFYNLHRSLVHGGSVHPATPLRLSQAAQAAPGKKNTAAGSAQAHSHQRAVDPPPLLRAIQVPTAASRLQVTPSKAAAAAAGTSAANQSSSAAIHGTLLAQDTPVNILRKSWQDAVADMASHLGVNYNDASSSHGEQSATASSTPSLHPSQFSAQVKGDQDSIDSINVIVQVIRSGEKADEMEKEHKPPTD